MKDWQAVAAKIVDLLIGTPLGVTRLKLLRKRLQAHIDDEHLPDEEELEALFQEACSADPGELEAETGEKPKADPE